jgi:hypothetical protein
MSALSIHSASPKQAAQPSELLHLRTINDLAVIGRFMAESNLFRDTRSAAQAMVKIQAGQELGIPPYAAMAGIFIINDKLVMSGNMIAAMVKRSGKYNYRVLEHDAKHCSIQFYEGGEPCGPPSAFSMDDAATAGLTGNPNWKKYVRNMLFNRALTNGVRWHCADVFLGPVYTPDEMGVEEDEGGNAINVPTVAPRQPDSPPPAPPEPARPASSHPLAPKSVKVQVGQAIADWTGIDPRTPDFRSVCVQIAKAAGIENAGKVELNDEQVAKVFAWVEKQRADGLDFTVAIKPAPAAPAPAAPEAPAVQEITNLLVRVNAVTERTKRFKVSTDHGDFFTFSTTIAAECKASIGALISVVFKKGQYGRDIESVKVIGDAPAPAPAPAAPSEPESPADPDNEIPF